MEKILLLALLLTAAVSCTVSERHKKAPLETVSSVDLKQYLGRWYQIAYFPVRFQPGDCAVVTADYGLNDKGRVTVYNVCWADSEMTTVRSDITGNATVVEGSNNAKLMVRFFWWLPFRSNYWIISLDSEDYQYSVVSEPNRNYLWILARENKMERELFNSLVSDLRERGFNIDRLKITAELY